MNSITPVILSGGSGTRLWPLSREAHPKQFLPVIGAHSLLQATALRLRGLSAQAPIVVANESHRFLVAEQLQAIGIPAGALLLEPVGRNTAPAIAAAAFQALAADPDAVLLVMPSDHAITDVAGFQAAVTQALSAAQGGAIVTFGIVPEAPETGFGYIKAKAGEGVRAIERFVEKPDAATAEAYVASGDYFWNSGMFLFKARVYLDELSKSHPLMVDLAETAVAKAVALAGRRTGRQRQCPSRRCAGTGLPQHPGHGREAPAGAAGSGRHRGGRHRRRRIGRAQGPRAGSERHRGAFESRTASAGDLAPEGVPALGQL